MLNFFHLHVIRPISQQFACYRFSGTSVPFTFIAGIFVQELFVSISENIVGTFPDIPICNSQCRIPTKSSCQSIISISVKNL